MTGIERLSENERAVLELLAQGYDIKSLAAALTITPSAATERLRAARAKLGVTSSREAARLYAAAQAPAQKTWDRQSGVPQSREIGPAQSHGAEGPRRWIWGLIMLVTLVAAAAAAVLYTGADPSTGSSGPSAATAPRAVSVSPANGSAIAPGQFTLTITFDQPMAANSYSFVQTSEGAYPRCTGKPVQSADRRSFSLSCTATAGTRYAIGFNRGRFQNFRSAAGVPAVPAGTVFTARGR